MGMFKILTLKIRNCDLFPRNEKAKNYVVLNFRTFDLVCNLKNPKMIENVRVMTEYRTEIKDEVKTKSMKMAIFRLS